MKNIRNKNKLKITNKNNKIMLKKKYETKKY